MKRSWPLYAAPERLPKPLDLIYVAALQNRFSIVYHSNFPVLLMQGGSAQAGLPLDFMREKRKVVTTAVLLKSYCELGNVM
jgi:hypothetical protein